MDAKTLDEAGLLSREDIDRLTDEGLRDAVVGELAEEYREWEHRRDSHGRWARMPGGAAVLDKPHEFAKLAGKALTTGGGFSLDRDGHVLRRTGLRCYRSGYEHKVSGLPRRMRLLGSTRPIGANCVIPSSSVAGTTSRKTRPIST